ncbi:MAG: primosomal protein N' [Actinomycetota bacterium]|nr:primosomal protein N' [Actinomycetota bacterium]
MENKNYAEVVIDTPVRHLDRPFHYLVPQEFKEKLEVGSLVMVPFGNRLSLGYVVGFPDSPQVGNLKEIASVLDEPPIFGFDTLRLCQWIASRYISSLSQALHLIMPPGRTRKIKEIIALKAPAEEVIPAITPRDTFSLAIVEVISAAGGSLDYEDLKKHFGSPQRVSSATKKLEGLGVLSRTFSLAKPSVRHVSNLVVRLKGGLAKEDVEKLPSKQRALVEYLELEKDEIPRSQLLKETKTSNSSLDSLIKKGLVSVERKRRLRKPRTRGELVPGPPPTPNEHQEEAINRIKEAIKSGKTNFFLLEGVTGSGKTEVYMRAIEEVLSRGRGAIILVPEISLTPQTIERFESRFPKKVAVLHSSLSPGERYDQWCAIRDGTYPIVVGARSAIFAPLQNLGLIVIDEEHESTYKNDQAPHYHARAVAEERARIYGATLVAGNATPSFETYQKARAGIYSHLRLPRRIDNRPMPQIEIVDMKKVGGAGQIPLLSPTMLDSLSRTIEAEEQAILFLNRRGFSNYLQCKRCGNIPRCDNCDISLSYHAEGNFLLCHHCGDRREVPDSCEKCGSGFLKGVGAGTQRVAAEIQSNLPGATFLRMDSDATTTKDAHWNILSTFRSGKAQILIGTQMIAKGLDIPGITFVGVVNADTALALPDFRASERTYQLLTQVSGRAGRGLRPGKVVIQTFNPEHPALKALFGNPQEFVERELQSRLEAFYPPFCELVNVIITSPDPTTAARSAARMKKILQNNLQGKQATILGPAPAPISRLKGNYRWHILIKTGEVEKISSSVSNAIGRFYGYKKGFPLKSEVKVWADVDPVSLL